MYEGDIASVLISEEQIEERTAELAEAVAARYADESMQDDLLLVVSSKRDLFMTDFARALPIPTQMEFMPSARTARRRRRPAWCGSSRISTRTSPAGTC